MKPHKRLTASGATFESAGPIPSLAVFAPNRRRSLPPRIMDAKREKILGNMMAAATPHRTHTWLKNLNRVFMR